MFFNVCEVIERIGREVLFFFVEAISFEYFELKEVDDPLGEGVNLGGVEPNRGWVFLAT